MKITTQDLKLKLESIRQAKHYVKDVKAELDNNKQQLKLAKQKLDKENEDVEDLQHLTLLHLRAIITNTKDERVCMEKQEAIATQLLVDTLYARDKALRNEYRKLCLLIDEEEAVEKKLDELHRAKIFQNNRALCIEIDDKITHNRSINQKLNETVDNIQLISRRLDVAFKHIDDVYLFDITLESGVFTKTVKHNMLMDIECEMEAIRLDIMRLKEEFKTIRTYELSNLHIPLDLVLRDYDRYDIFYFAQHKIHKNMNDTMKNIRSFQMQIQDYVIELRKQIQENNGAYELLQDEYEHAQQVPKL